MEKGLIGGEEIHQKDTLISQGESDESRRSAFERKDRFDRIRIKRTW